jgi:hypothetical protein
MDRDIGEYSEPEQPKIEVPASTAWPIVLAFGLTLAAAGLVTSASVSILGALLAATAAVGWFREVLPVESHEWVPVVGEQIAIQRSWKTVDRIAGIGTAPRAWLPIEIYPVSAGIKGGLAGGAVMALIAGAYGLFSGNGIWYAMNLLVAGLFPSMATETVTQIGAFNLHRFLVAVPIHLLISLLVGLLYGAMLPVMPRHPILFGGFAAPVLWCGLIYGGLAFINPVMNQRIAWPWFVASQIAFGIAAGLVVAVQERILTPENVPLIGRIGVEASGLARQRREDQRR